jgi:hypothetical protein
MEVSLTTGDCSNVGITYTNALPLSHCANLKTLDVEYRIKFYSDIRYNVGLRSLQSDIGSSDIKLSPISLITDIGVSAHLCLPPND